MNDAIYSTPDATFQIVQSEEELEEYLQSLAENLDDQPGIQCKINLADLFESPYDTILRSGKANSGYENDLIDIYHDYLRNILEKSNEMDIVTSLKEEFPASKADPFEAEVTGEALTMGFEVESAILEKLESLDSIHFNEHDLAAALEFAPDQEEIIDEQAYGTVVIWSSSPISELERRNRPVSELPQIIQSLLLKDMNIRLVAPRGPSDERDIVEDLFKKVSSMTIQESSPTSMEIGDHTKQVIDSWYEKLNYAVEHRRVPERVVRPASVTAYDLPSDRALDHFVNAITIGLQNTYSVKKFNEDRFEELWSNRVTPHNNYYQYRSERQSFPKVTVAREDGLQHQFELHHEGPNNQPRLNGTPVQTNSPEKELIDLIIRFLDAEVADENSWSQILELTKSELASNLPIDSVQVAEDALLRAHRIRSDTTPRLPPTRETDSQVDIPSDDVDWYQEHWAKILSGSQITNGSGVGMMADKKELCRSLNPESQADRGLFYKLQKDLDKAWSHFPESVERQVLDSLPDELDTTIEIQENTDRTEINVEVHPPDSESVKTTVTIHIPYSDVRIAGERVSRATVSNTVSEVLETFQRVLYSRPELPEGFDEQLSLYQVIRLYCTAVGVTEGDSVYFDEIIDFCLSLPGVWECFQRPEKTAEESLRASLPSLISQLQGEEVTLHRKGNDNHGAIKLNKRQYTAMELCTDNL